MKTQKQIPLLRFAALLGIAFTAPAPALAMVFSPIPHPSPTPLPVMKQGASIQLPFNLGDDAKPEKIGCFRTVAPSNSELTKAILAYRTGKTVDGVIGSVRLLGEDAVLVDALNTLARASDGQIYGFSKIAFETRENRVLDALELAKQTFGEREGLQILYLFLRYRINASHYLFVKLAPWAAEELDSVLLALSDLPSHLVPFPLNADAKAFGFQPLVRSEHGTKFEDKEKNTVVLADATMQFFDAWTEKSALARRTSVFHEIAHNLHYLISDRQSWTNLSPWPAEIKYNVLKDGEHVEVTKKIHSTYAGNHTEPFVTTYAKASPGEDFAESATAYRYRADWLRERNPEKYEYLKEVIFDGIEYESDAACTRAKSASGQYADALRNSFVQFQLDALDGRALGDEELARKRPACDAQMLRTAVSHVGDARSIHSHCVGELYLEWFHRKQGRLARKYEADSREVRRADHSGGDYDPQLNYYAEAKVAAFARVQIRNAILQDFRAYAGTPGASLKKCSLFAEAFPKWAAAQGRKSAIAGTRLFAVASGADSLGDFLEHVCTNAMESRPNYQRLWERIAPVQPLGFSEFRPVLIQALGD